MSERNDDEEMNSEEEDEVDSHEKEDWRHQNARKSVNNFKYEELQIYYKTTLKSLSQMTL